MTMKALIDNKFGSPNNMAKATDKISRTYIYRIYRGVDKNVTIDILMELSNILETPVNDLVKILTCSESTPQ